MKSRPHILFLCTGNSCRSQMAEGFCRHLHPRQFKVSSAGLEKHGLNPHATMVMAEKGIDLKKHHSKTLDDIDLETIDYVITVCDHAHETCPLFPGRALVIHHSFPDPPGLADQVHDPEAKITCYRQVRDLIEAFVRDLPRVLARH